ALTEFILSMGASKSIVSMEMDKLWATNKKHIDPVVPRYSVVDATDKVLVNLADGADAGDVAPKEVEFRDVPKHQKNAALGMKPVRYLNRIWIEGADAALLKDGEEVTLMNWGNCIIKKVHSADGKITSCDGVLNLQGDFKKTEKKLTWLAD